MAAKAKSKLGWVLCALALVGVVVSALGTSHFYDIRNGSAGFRSFCDLNASMNCDVVTASSYAEVLPGIPLSTIAAGWFLAIFLAALFLASAEWRREALRFEALFTGIGVLTSVFYFAVMALKIKTFCLLCLVTDGINVASFALVLFMRPEGPSSAPFDGKQWKTLALTSIGAIFVTVVTLHSLDQRAMSTSEIKDNVESILQSPIVSVNADNGSPIFGPKDAPVTIVEFSDFQCPFCRIGAFAMKSVLDRYPDSVRLVFKAFPLDPSCNRGVQHSMHAVACEAAKTALCSAPQDKFKPVYESLFEHQEELTPGKPAELAQAAGVDPGKLAACMSSTDVGSAIARDVEEGIALGIQSTPTFFINGHRADGAFPLPVWSQVIDQLLKK